ncbi:MAG: MlaD family protein [Motiliproteus sp.]|nr:MlaD family protein [Motiliproteus sp.]MCW9051588.1 MlaD family protein [Motiliproteus sp.]
MGKETLDTPVKARSKSISAIWFVPLIALIAAGWLGYRAWQQTGPTIELHFSNASGIVAGKTEIRFKDVKIGLVTDIKIDEALYLVKVKAEIDPVAASHISSNSRFWVVQPRVTLSGISGLNTLLSGVYIQVDPGDSGPFQNSFRGLDEPPSVISTDKGTSYQLAAETLGSLDIGSPVYYRQIQIGEVSGYNLADDGESVNVRIFIDAPHDQQVKSNSRFWNISGFGMELNAQGLKANMTSLASLIAGGIAFDTPDDPSAQSAVADQQFNLFKDKQAVAEQVYTIKYPYLMNFTGSVRGLEIGAPVEYRGIKVGEVEQIRFVRQKDFIQVLVNLEPQRLSMDNSVTREELDGGLKRIIEEGMRAQLKTGNLITGALFIDLVSQEDAPDGTLILGGSYPEIPTVEGQFEQLSRQLNVVIDKVNSFPLESIGDQLVATLSDVRTIAAELKQQRLAAKVGSTLDNLEGASGKLEGTLKAANKAMAQATETLKSVDSTVAPDSELRYQVLRLIDQLTKASNAYRELAEELNRNPNALLFGKEKR